MTEPEPDGPEGPAPAAETQDEKRARVMRRLAEMIRADPPDFSGGGPVSLGANSPGGFPGLPTSADEFDQEAAAELLAALQGFFELRRPAGPAGSSQDLEETSTQELEKE